MPRPGPATASDSSLPASAIRCSSWPCAWASLTAASSAELSGWGVVPVELDGQLVAAALGPLPGQLSGLEQRRQLRLPVDCAVDPRPLDARRKVGILRALAGLGRHTKVIAFTHDPQVVALAQKAVDRDLLTVHELGGNEISGALQAQISTADVRPIRPAQAA